jgi:hypothetical protein
LARGVGVAATLAHDSGSEVLPLSFAWAIVRASALAGMALLASACVGGRGLPPFYERETGLPGGLSEDRAVFGLVSRTRGEDDALLSAIRPLVAKVEDGRGAEKVHVLSPIVVHGENKNRVKTTVWPLFFDTLFGTEEEQSHDASDNDTAIFPFFLWGHEPGQGSYFAAFPLYGTLKGKLLADRIDFVLFPLYAHTDAGDWHSTHLIWPLIAWGESPTRSHFRVMPFWSQSDSARRSSRTLLWPIGQWGWEKRGNRTFDSWFVFPLVGHRTSRDGQFSAWTTLFPFFEFSYDERTRDRYVGAPWPFHKYEFQAGRSEATWWWPAYGHYDSLNESSSFYAWPIVWDATEHRGNYVYERTYVVPVWMQRKTTALRERGIPDEEIRSWPLFSWRRRPDGYESLRVPEIIPFFGWEAGETLYADILTLFSWRSDRQGRVAWDGPLSIVRMRKDLTGAKTLTLLWWIDIPLGGGR